MKERLIGDDQLLVTADTTLGDPLWDWVAADAARRAPDGWRIANIGGVGTQMAAPSARPTATRAGYADRRHALDPVPPVSGGTSPSGDARAGRGPRRDRTRVRRLPDRGRYDRATVDAILDAGDRRARRAGSLDGQPYATPDVRLAPGRPALLARLRGQPDAPGDRRPAGLRHGRRTLDGLVLARSGFNHSVNYRSVDGPRHRPPRHGRRPRSRRRSRRSSSTSTPAAGPRCAR